MSQFRNIAFRHKFHRGVGVDGVPSSSIDFIDIGAKFEHENEAISYLIHSFIPSWNSNVGGDLPLYYLVESAEAKRIYKIQDSVPSIYFTFWEAP